MINTYTFFLKKVRCFDCNVLPVWAMEDNLEAEMLLLVYSCLLWIVSIVAGDTLTSASARSGYFYKDDVVTSTQLLGKQ